MLFHETSVFNVSGLPLSLAYVHTYLPKTVLSRPSEIVEMTINNSRIRTNQFTPMNNQPIILVRGRRDYHLQLHRDTTYREKPIRNSTFPSCDLPTTRGNDGVTEHLTSQSIVSTVPNAKELITQTQLLPSVATVLSPSSPLAHPTDSYRSSGTLKRVYSSSFVFLAHVLQPSSLMWKSMY